MPGNGASGSGSSQTISLQRSKDEIWILAGLSAEVWAETRGEEGIEKGMGMVESEVGCSREVIRVMNMD